MTQSSGQLVSLKPRREELTIRREFMPVAMELEATPASPLGRFLLWFIVSMFVFAVVWASIGKVDVIAVAEGHILPSGKARTLQPSTLGVVSTIQVRNGDQVEQGQPLIVLDNALTRAELIRLEETISKREKRLARLQAYSDWIDAPASADEQTDNPLQQLQDPLLKSQAEAFHSTEQMLREQQRARESERAYAQSVVSRLQQVLPLIEERANAVKSLQDQRMAARMQWLELEQHAIELRGQLQAEHNRVIQLQAEVRELEQRRLQLRHETLRDTLTEMEVLQSELAELAQEWAKAQVLEQQQVLMSPVRGTVHELQINNPGAVVQPAQVLLEIIPDDEELLVEAWILNRDIGFVREGLSASVKVHTFQFTKYGSVPATLISISRDAVVDEREGPRYLARLKLERDWMDINGQRINLTPGMTVSTEIATGQRRLIEFFAAPVLSALDEAGRER
ncbi:HlyD family type I secretion periplasmic adaptor subunit [Nitrincola sp. MINF-07-Sa-05]|uniref:HlyD family type I secretion periplasmic adaptor subunit n=1 Tax=Nitrincola salilacus TaxID=3400273 RepID=UPI0039185B8E